MSETDLMNTPEVSPPNKDSSESLNEESAPLSKRAQKRLKALELFKERRKRIRAKEKEKTKLKRQKRCASGGPSDFEIKLYKKDACERVCKVNVVIDLSFHDLMSDKDLRKLMKQCGRCYAENRKHSKPLNFHLVGVCDKMHTYMDTCLPGYSNWTLCNIKNESYLDAFPKSNIVYLTAESENQVETLKDDHFYVIGGLVDHNAHKGYCHKLAVEKEVTTARLPIDQYFKLYSRKVLAINHVFEILLHFNTTNSWKDAIAAIMPKRKGLEDIESQ